jgi:hypothetical protein
LNDDYFELSQNNSPGDRTTEALIHMITLISKPERFFGVNQSSFCHNIPSTDSIRHPEQLNLSGRGTRSTVRRQSSIPNLQFSTASI